MEFVRGSTLLVTVIAASVCAALIFGLTMLSSKARRDVVTPPAIVVATIDAPKPPAQASGQISNVVLAERPLFHTDRRPYSGEFATETSFSPEPTNASHIKLKGVIRRGGTARAYVELIGGGEPVWLKAGESLAGWTLKQVSDDGVVLSDGTRNISLKLHPDVNR